MPDDSLFLFDPKSKLWQGAGQSLDSRNHERIVRNLDEIDSSGKFVAEVKEDGHYTTAYCNGEGNVFVSRNIKVQNCPELNSIPLPAGMIVAGELGVGTEYATRKRKQLGHEYVIIHRLIETPINYRNQFPRDATKLDEQSQRRALEIIWSDLNAHVKSRFQLAPRYKAGFASLYADVIESGGEGLVIKAINPTVDTSFNFGVRSPYWIKVKKTLTVDMVVLDVILSNATSFKDRNMARAIVCGLVIDGRLMPTTNVGSMDHSHRQLFGANKEQFLGSVVEIGAFEQFQSGSLRHPWFIRLREDKGPDDCRFGGRHD